MSLKCTELSLMNVKENEAILRKIDENPNPTMDNNQAKLNPKEIMHQISGDIPNMIYHNTDTVHPNMMGISEQQHSSGSYPNIVCQKNDAVNMRQEMEHNTTRVSNPSNTPISCIMNDAFESRDDVTQRSTAPHPSISKPNDVSSICSKKRKLHHEDISDESSDDSSDDSSDTDVKYDANKVDKRTNIEKHVDVIRSSLRNIDYITTKCRDTLVPYKKNLQHRKDMLRKCMSDEGLQTVQIDANWKFERITKKNGVSCYVMINTNKKIKTK